MRKRRKNPMFYDAVGCVLLIKKQFLPRYILIRSGLGGTPLNYIKNAFSTQFASPIGPGFRFIAFPSIYNVAVDGSDPQSVKIKPARPLSSCSLDLLSFHCLSTKI
ncbi:hypothetical protein GWI33_001606 [Rhynchophorus ferrugineus]|uniref:Uncharacterized protein n=1 Tax=Rhynchophorus ferrugineus TaxID=354439 RepID=A0A834M1L1_RHYFE|nr:hypothetical protein GWI33_001606 [Rhynchophorus ferrugineus]